MDYKYVKNAAEMIIQDVINKYLRENPEATVNGFKRRNVCPSSKNSTGFIEFNDQPQKSLFNTEYPQKPGFKQIWYHKGHFVLELTIYYDRHNNQDPRHPDYDFKGVRLSYTYEGGDCCEMVVNENLTFNLIF